MVCTFGGSSRKKPGLSCFGRAFLRLRVPPVCPVVLSNEKIEQEEDHENNLQVVWVRVRAVRTVRIVYFATTLCVLCELLLLLLVCTRIITLVSYKHVVVVVHHQSALRVFIV